MKKSRFARKMVIIFTGLLAVMWALCHGPAYSAEVEIPSSFNPVGSGARALGFGGAFIAIADDATAASWNPGGLTQLQKPECSVVGSFFHRGEDLTFGTNPEADGSHSISDQNINYLSVTYPFEISKYNMVLSLSYQHLYDFNREWKFKFKEDAELQVGDDHYEYEQTGSLTALGLSYCIRLLPQFSAGFTLNFWDDDLSPNNWKENYKFTSTGIMAGIPFVENFNRTEDHSISGFNFNLGFLWKINYKWTLGGVFKSPFKADLEHKIQWSSVIDHPLLEPYPYEPVKNKELEMPMSYGIGVVHNVSDNFSVSADLYRTEWDDCFYRDEYGNEFSPITNGPASEIDPTHQVRIGAEYRFIDPEKEYLIPIRCGFFYDPAPAEGSPDDFYGFSFGLGFTKNDWLSLDVAYQYRFADDVGKHLMIGRELSQDVDEHMVYLSMIWYKFD